MLTKLNAIEIAESLLPCPFCGEKPVALIRGKGNNAFNPVARCMTEDCMGGKVPGLLLDVPSQIAGWNTRAAINPSFEG